jgi:hypothetical protein
MNRCFFTVALALVALAAQADAQSVTWDLGTTDAALARCENEPQNFERYPSQVFGPYYPTGAWVTASIGRGRCVDWPNVPGTCFGLFIANFHPAAGCGCAISGLLDGMTELELHYDPAAVAAAGVAESSLRLYAFGTIGSGWVEVPDAQLDTQANALRAGAVGFILGFRWYAIAGEAGTTGVEASAWGGVKSLWR